MEIRSSLVGQGRTRALVKSLCPCPAKAQATRHVVLQLDARFRVTRTIGSANWTCNPPPTSLKLFSLQWPKKTTVDTTRPHSFAHFFGLSPLDRHGCNMLQAGDDRWQDEAAKCRASVADERFIDPRKTGNRVGWVEKGSAAFWRASDGKWRFPMAQPSLVGQTRSHVPEVLVALLRRFFVEEGTRCLLVAQMQVPFLPRACHLLLSEENSAKLQKNISVSLVDSAC